MSSLKRGGNKKIIKSLSLLFDLPGMSLDRVAKTSSRPCHDSGWPDTQMEQRPIEGHMNRLKFVKRSMSGRANFDLLRFRVLHHRK